MTSTKDIKDAGGSCEYVATDFWECTDKDGKKWWCSDGGKTCVPKPRVWQPGREDVFRGTMDVYLVPDDDGGFVITTPVAGGNLTRVTRTEFPQPKPDNEGLSRALRWVADRSPVRRAIEKAVQTKTLSVPDSLLADPTLVVKAAEAASQEARKQKAPDDVLGALDELVNRYRLGAERLPQIEYTAAALRGLQGMRDRSELEGPLSKALDEAPDDANRMKLTQIAALIRRPRSFDLGFPTLDPGLGISCDWGCCAFACVMCVEACPICCAAACLLC